MLTGTLKTFSLAGLLQICSNEGSTGALDFSIKGSFCGRIGFEKGDVVYADFTGIKGIDALRQISLLKETEFVYNKDTETGERNIDMEIDFLMIDCSRYQDECLSYMEDLQKTFPGKYTIEEMSIFEFDNPIYRVLNIRNINYFEYFDNEKYQIVYLDKNINARIKIVFKGNIVTDYLLIHLKEKGMLQ
ncbi:MAG: DUF4388 domain-containing protein [Desulfamplus sp.]|nr:DUF4388 domain-containing protein [Desulfamplus sp.]